MTLATTKTVHNNNNILYLDENKGASVCLRNMSSNKLLWDALSRRVLSYNSLIIIYEFSISVMIHVMKTSTTEGRIIISHQGQLAPSHCNASDSPQQQLDRLMHHVQVTAGGRCHVQCCLSQARQHNQSR